MEDRSLARAFGPRRVTSDNVELTRRGAAHSLPFSATRVTKLRFLGQIQACGCPCCDVRDCPRGLSDETNVQSPSHHQLVTAALLAVVGLIAPFHETRRSVCLFSLSIVPASSFLSRLLPTSAPVAVLGPQGERGAPLPNTYTVTYRERRGGLAPSSDSRIATPTPGWI